MLLIVFIVSMFVSATLLFLVEPMVGKMALPMLGGTPAVWNTCLVFFQANLLLGYLYAYASTKWLGRRTQIAVHIGLALLPVTVLSLHIPKGWEPPAQSSPVLWVFGMLTVTVGPPFFLLSSSTPMLQRWFSESGHRSAHDPYFLYAASNAGSMVGLLGYPLLLEPNLRLSVQSHLWSYGYLIFFAMTAVCGFLVWRPHGHSAIVEAEVAPTEPATDDAISWTQRLRWIALAFVPSSLMIGVTTALTTDVPAIPLFWVLPLAFYLLSFVLVFASKPPISREWLIRRLPFLILIALIPTVSKTKLPLSALLVIYLAALFAVSLMCHGELARSRPRVSKLTEFYLWISFGGVLGGIFNSVVAPLIFSSVLEFPLVLVFAALLRPPIDQKPAATPAKEVWARRKDWLLPLGLGVAMVAVIEGLARAGLQPGRPLVILIFGYSMVWCMSFGKQPFRFAVGLVVLLLASSLYTGPFGQILHTERSFFGVSRVTDDPSGRFRSLFHGGTSHGLQSLNASASREPLAYYSRTGPAGSVMRAMQAKGYRNNSGADRKANWAVVGLGAGAMACYREPGESLTYYEIDSAVSRIALDTRYFTFLSQCAPSAHIVMGDARLKLRDAPDASYDLIVLDAFSGDSIPMHLLTSEALNLYLRKLAPGGILAFHISNLKLDLGPTLGALAQDAGLVSLVGDDTGIAQAVIDQGKYPSKWVVMARSQSDLGALGKDPRWIHVRTPPGTQVWTDDFSNLLRVIKWD